VRAASPLTVKDSTSVALSIWRYLQAEEFRYFLTKTSDRRKEADTHCAFSFLMEESVVSQTPKSQPGHLLGGFVTIEAHRINCCFSATPALKKVESIDPERRG
jgi:hypothetical protein